MCITHKGIQCIPLYVQYTNKGRHIKLQYTWYTHIKVDIKVDKVIHTWSKSEIISFSNLMHSMPLLISSEQNVAKLGIDANRTPAQE